MNLRDIALLVLLTWVGGLTAVNLAQTKKIDRLEHIVVYIALSDGLLSESDLRVAIQQARREREQFRANQSHPGAAAAQAAAF